jgi:hypothetical protein
MNINVTREHSDRLYRTTWRFLVDTRTQRFILILTGRTIETRATLRHKYREHEGASWSAYSYRKSYEKAATPAYVPADVLADAYQESMVGSTVQIGFGR